MFSKGFEAMWRISGKIEDEECGDWLGRCHGRGGRSGCYGGVATRQCAECCMIAECSVLYIPREVLATATLRGMLYALRNVIWL